MKKNRIPMILLFLAGILIVGACEDFDDPVIVPEPIENLEKGNSLESPEDADEYKKEKPGHTHE